MTRPGTTMARHRSSRRPVLGGLLALVAAVVTCWSLITAVALVRPQLPASDAATAPGSRAQLAFLDAALAGGAGERMQGLFPEGAFFTAALDGLAWVHVGLAAREAGDETGRAAAVAGARRALALVDGPLARSPFSPDLDPAFGVFYVGWSSWLRGGLLALQEPGERDALEVRRLRSDCAALAAAFRASSTPFLAAYPGQAWPVDSVVAAAALRLHDHVLAPRYDALVRDWLVAAMARVDPATGLLPHRADSRDGHPLEGARGSSQSIIARFLVEVDPALGAEQYARFRATFATTVAGLPGILEHPRGTRGSADVDSGPLVAGISAPASVVALAAAQVHGDRALAEPLAATAELVGLPVTLPSGKRYAGGALPVGDAFLVWARSARPLVADVVACDCAPLLPRWWRLPWIVVLLGVAALAWVPAALLLRGRAALVRRPLAKKI